MEMQYFKMYSPALNRDMECKVYGHAGRPVLFIPCQDGRFFDFEGYKMAEVWSPWIESGQVMVIAIDTIDKETWSDKNGNADYRINNQKAKGNIHRRKPFKEKSGNNHKHAADDERNTGKKLALFPGDVVFHAPGSSQTYQGIVAEFRHEVSDYRHSDSHQNAEKAVYIGVCGKSHASRGGKSFIN